jgi:transcriptional regulator with XRE-family HTH domain
LIHQAREQQGWTLKQLAEHCEKQISPEYISQIEGNQKVPSERVCGLLAQALHLDEEELAYHAFLLKAPERFRYRLQLQADATQEADATQAPAWFNGWRALQRVVEQCPDEKVPRLLDLMRQFADEFAKAAAKPPKKAAAKPPKRLLSQATGSSTYADDADNVMEPTMV